MEFLRRTCRASYRYDTRRTGKLAVESRLLLLIFGFLLLGPKQNIAQSEPANHQRNSVRGTVVNSVTQTPVARALVYSSDDRFAMLTDGDGRFEFYLPNADNEDSGDKSGGNRILFLMARRPGFLEGPSESPPTLASPGEDATISLVPESLITGRVILSTGEPASDVSVQILARGVVNGFPRWVSKQNVLTNSAGEFRFFDLPRGAYKLLTREWMDNDPVAATPGAQLFGFPPVYYPGVSDFASSSTIDLAAGQTNEADLTLVRTAYFPVRIPVVGGDANGGMNVEVNEQRGPGYSLGYNPATRRIEGLLPSGSYLVEASTAGSNSSAGKMNVKVAGGPLAGETMTLGPNSSIALHVKEAFSDLNWNGTGAWSDGKHTFAVRGPRLYLSASVEAADDSERPVTASIRQPTGPNDDSLVLDGVSPGRYWLQLTTGRGYVASATAGSLDLLREPLIVESGSNIPVDVNLRDDGGEIEGIVTNIANRSPASGVNGPRVIWSPRAWVYLVPLLDRAGQFQPVAVTSDGRFSSTLAPGSYRALAFRDQQPNLPYRDPEGMKFYENKGPVIDIVAGQKTTVQVELIASSQ